MLDHGRKSARLGTGLHGAEAGDSLNSTSVPLLVLVQRVSWSVIK